MTPQQVCQAAYEYILKHGWTRGRFRDHAGRVCLRKAVGMVADNPADAVFAADLLRKRTGTTGDLSLTQWNDAQNSAAPVLALLKAAAEED